MGNKADLLPDDLPPIEGEGEQLEPSAPQQDFVTLKHAKRITERERFKLAPVECSSLTGKGVKKVFDIVAAELAGESPKWSRINCAIL